MKDQPQLHERIVALLDLPWLHTSTKLTLLVKSACPDREEGHTKRLHYLAQGVANG